MALPTDLPGDITALLTRWSEGDQAALTSLASLAYDDLRSIAIGYLRREGRGDHTLQATALVNELYLRLADQRSVKVSGREHFFAFSAMMMRRILTDYARRTAAQKRPTAAQRIPLSEDLAWVDAASEEMISLDSALAELETMDARAVRCLELRVFLGCTLEEAAAIVGTSLVTVKRDVDFAVAWLYRRLAGDEKSAGGLRDSK